MRPRDYHGNQIIGAKIRSQSKIPKLSVITRFFKNLSNDCVETLITSCGTHCIKASAATLRSGKLHESAFFQRTIKHAEMTSQIFPRIKNGVFVNRSNWNNEEKIRRLNNITRKNKDFWLSLNEYWALFHGLIKPFQANTIQAWLRLALC